MLLRLVVLFEYFRFAPENLWFVIGFRRLMIDEYLQYHLLSHMLIRESLKSVNKGSFIMITLR